jgi:hypothetical protein
VRFFAEYTYAAGALLMLLVALGCGLLWRGPAAAQGRRGMLYSALLGWPFGLFSFENIPKYWVPKTIAWFGAASPEDLVFVCGSAAVTWCWAILPLRGRLRHAALERAGQPGPADWRGILLRFVAGSAPGIGLAYALGLGIAGTKVITATLWGYALGGALLLWLKRDCWRMMLYGGAGFTLTYLLLLRLILWRWPAFAGAWNSSLQPQPWLLGLPLHEYGWAIGYGTVWPLFVAWCLGTRLAAAADD